MRSGESTKSFDVRPLSGRRSWARSVALISLSCLVAMTSFVALGPSSGLPEPGRTSAMASIVTRAPQPSGILPCAKRRVVLTNVYRHRNRLRFEGVARFSLRGETVRIRSRGKRVATAQVRPDGTWWASAADPGQVFRGRSEFTALVQGRRSWPRRLGQAVAVLNRTPPGPKAKSARPRVKALVARTGGISRVVLARQTGCRKQIAVAVMQMGSAPDGKVRVRIPRPSKGQPYAIYRLRTRGGNVVSPPIVVRPAR